MTFLLKIGTIDYDTLGKGFKYILIIAAGLGAVYFNRNYRPKL